MFVPTHHHLREPQKNRLGSLKRITSLRDKTKEKEYMHVL